MLAAAISKLLLFFKEIKKNAKKNIFPVDANLTDAYGVNSHFPLLANEFTICWRCCDDGDAGGISSRSLLKRGQGDEANVSTRNYLWS